MNQVDSSPKQVYTKIDGRLAMFKRKTDRAFWDDLYRGTPDNQLKRALRATQNLGTHAKFFRRWIPQDGFLLEAGCGSGIWVSRLRENGYRCVGIDFALENLMRSRKYRIDLPLIGGDIFRLPFSNETFSCYLSFGVLEHLRNGARSFLMEARRILKRGGRLCISVPFENHFLRKVSLSTEERAISHGLEFSHYFFKMDDVKRELVETGFEPQKAFHGYYVNIGLQNCLNLRFSIVKKILAARIGLLLDFLPFLPSLAAHMVFTVAVRN
jgi:SAM-dependent methyltransferase